MTAPLFGLVLAGGASTRMQQDKAALAYHGKPQLNWAYDLLADLCAATFISVRPDQRDEPTRAGTLGAMTSAVRLSSTRS